MKQRLAYRICARDSLWYHNLRERKEIGVGRGRSWAVIQFQWRPQLSPQGALELGIALKSCFKSLSSPMMISYWVQLLLGGGMTLNEAIFFSWSNLQRGLQSEWHLLAILPAVKISPSFLIGGMGSTSQCPLHSLCLYILICKMRIIIVPTSSGCDED